MTTSKPATSPAKGPRNHAIRFAREFVVVVVAALVVSALLRGFVGQMFVIPSGSMENTLMIDDRVAVQKITAFHRGDVVVFVDPGNWLSETTPERGRVGKALEFVGVLPDTSTGHLIKRVTGTPGDTVICCDNSGRVTVNGQPLDESSYLYSDQGGQSAPSTITFKVVVPAGRIFVMGDHRDASADSRCHLADPSDDGPTGSGAFVPVELVVGPAFAIVSPLSRASRLQRPDTFGSVPEPPGPAPQQASVEVDGVPC